MDMERRADTPIAAGRQPANLWRKALDAIRACNRLGHVVRRSTSYTAITIHHHDGHSDADADSWYPAAAAAAADVDGGSLKRLLKEMDEECFRRLGGGAGVAAKLASHPEWGIAGDADDVRRRKADFGVNACPKPEFKSFFGHVRDALSDVFLIALLVCSAVSLGVGIKEHGLKDGWYDGASLFLAVFLVSSLTAVCSHRQARRADKLASESADTVVTVVRAARRQEVSTFDVVVGDVVILRSGDAVPADGVLLHGHGLRVDEPHPGPVEIQAERNPFLASGVKVLDGHGSMLVTAVGTDTSLGEALRSHTDPHPATLQERLEGHTSTVGKVADAVAAVAFTVLTARHFTGCGTGMMPLLDKGVALAATLMLTLSMKPVVMDNALVHRLSALETMASVTAICADKTGTLTLNQMSVAEFWVGAEQPSSATAIAGGVVNLLRQGAGLNTTGSVYMPDNASPPEISGSPTEKALLSWAVACLGMDAATLRRSFSVLEVEAFDSHRKHSRAVIRDNANGVVLAHWKGAADVVLAGCSMYVDTRGDARELGVEQRNMLEKVSNDMGARGLRCIAFACKQVHRTEPSEIDDEAGLTLLGLVGLHDPCRPEVKAATEACTRAGVAVKMVTGDNIPTACAAANGCGIMSSDDSNGVVIEGPEFVGMPPARQLEMVDKLRVMARSRSGDKQVLVERLKQKGHVVAVTTGEGTSDARALGAADVVLYMRAPGARVAGSVRDIIILKGRFDAVVAAIRMGRCVYNNFQKMVQFYLTVNVVAIVVNFVPAVTTGDTPLTTEQLLWVNIVIGALSALAVATDKPSDALMDSPPVARTAPLVSNAMWRDLAAQAAFQVAVLLALQYRGRDVLGTDAKAMVFNVYVLCQVFNKFNTREMEKKNAFAGVLTSSSTMFLVFIAGMLVLQVVMVEVLGRLAGAERLGLGQWGICVAMAAVSWPVAMAAKFIPVTSPCRSSSHANALC